jgi:hypothetical protein
MAQYLKYKKNALWPVKHVMTITIIMLTLIQGCSNEEENMKISTSEINTLQKTEEFIEFTIAFSQYQEEMLAAINSMTNEERDFFLANKYDDEQMRLFIEKYDLSNSNLKLQATVYKFVHKTNFNNLNSKEKVELFMNRSYTDNKIKNIIPRLKNGNEIGTEPCYAEFQGKLTTLNSITSLKLVTCTCMLEVPFVACLCYVTVLADFYSDLAGLQEEYEDCLNE